MSKLSMVGTSLAVSGVILGSIVWNGAETLESAKTWINEATTKIELFQSNESKLTEGIKSKNAEISQLKAQINELSNNKTENETLIAELEAQVATLTNEKEALEAQLGNEEALVNEVERLNGELTKANADAEALQEALDNAVNLAEVEVAEESMVDNLLAETIVGEFVVGTHDYDDFTVTITKKTYLEVDVKNKSDYDMIFKVGFANKEGYEREITVKPGETKNDNYNGGFSKIEIYDQFGNLLWKSTI